MRTTLTEEANRGAGIRRNILILIPVTGSSGGVPTKNERLGTRDGVATAIRILNQTWIQTHNTGADPQPMTYTFAKESNS
jgi:hypothetical protein